MHKHLKGTFKEKDNTSPHLTTKPYVHNKVEDGSTEQSAATKKKKQQMRILFYNCFKTDYYCEGPMELNDQTNLCSKRSKHFHVFSSKNHTLIHSTGRLFKALRVCLHVCLCVYVFMCMFCPLSAARIRTHSCDARGLV